MTSVGEKIALLALALLFISGQANFVDPDMYHGMALIRESIQLGRIPLEDRFAYTPTVHPSIHHEWLEAAILYCVTTHAGAPGILILKHLLAAAIAAGSFHLARKRGAGLGVLCPLVPVAIFMSWIGMTTIRAQVFTLLFIVILLYCLEADERGKKRWVVPWLALYAFWLNMHGGFVVGVVLFCLHGVERILCRRPVKHLVITGLIMAALIACNPYGFAYYSYLWQAVLLDRSLIAEWRPLWEAWPPILLVFLISVVVAAYALWRIGFRQAPGWTLVLLTAYASLRHQRHLSIYAVVWFCHVPAYLERTILGEILTRFWARSRLAPLLLWSLLLLSGLTAVALKEPWKLRLPANNGENEHVLYPVGAVAYLDGLDRKGSLNVMVPFTAGAFVTWKLHPRVKVSLDGRFEAAYPPGALEESRRFYNALPGWREVLAKYPTDVALVPKSRLVSRAMRQESAWSCVYEDDVYELYARPGLALPRVDRRGEVLVGTFP